MKDAHWGIRRIDSDRGGVIYNVIDRDTGNVIIGGLVNRREADAIAAIPDLIRAAQASYSHIKAHPTKGSAQLLDQIRIALIKAAASLVLWIPV